MVLGRTGKRPQNRTGLTSARIRHVISHRATAARGIAPTLEVLGPRKIAEHAAGAAARKKARLAGKLQFVNVNSDADKGLA
jgi:hypothetical protein